MAKKLLIVDDQSFIRTLIKGKVKPTLAEDIEILEADNGDDAIMLAMKQRPSLILLDIIMPKIDGLTILQELKSNPETKDLPIVVVSSHADEYKRLKALELGAEKFINKADIAETDFAALVSEYL